MLEFNFFLNQLFYVASPSWVISDNRRKDFLYVFVDRLAPFIFVYPTIIFDITTWSRILRVGGFSDF